MKDFLNCKTFKMQTTGKDRNTIDKFYTKTDTVRLCLQEFKKHIIINEDDILIEPSAGDGSFLSLMIFYSEHVFGYDIEPEHKEIIKQDFLELDFKSILDLKSKNTKSNIFFIGNPPFGRQSSLAKKFIKKSSEVADAIGFILPKSFKKESCQQSFPLNFHLLSSIDLPNNSFLLNGKEYDVPCIFQVWVKKETSREIKTVEKPDFFEYVKKSEVPDLSIRRVGVYAGKIDKDCNKSEQSHYFLKLKDNTDDSIDKLISFFNESVKFETDNTAGPKSISKKE
jgi:predicted RNA methylase